MSSSGDLHRLAKTQRRRGLAALLAAMFAAGAFFPPPLSAAPAAKRSAPAKRSASPKKKSAPQARPAKGSDATPRSRGGAPFSSKYRSPRNKERPLRKSTRFIILHTTEGAARGALEKLSENGECHYVVETDRTIHTVIDRGRLAYHAGLSMWNGLTDLDACSIGIEVVGWHDKEATAAQFASLKRLVGDLSRVYKIPDERVLTHSMVAYGNPNHWQKKKHRGRKRCGMLFASAAARAKLGLAGKPSFDPDLRAGRLADADPELTKILYGKSPAARAKPASAPAESTADAGGPNPERVIGPKRSAWDIARDQYNAKSTIYTFPDGTKKRGNEISSREWRSMPAGTKVWMSGDTEPPPPPSAAPAAKGAGASGAAAASGTVTKRTGSPEGLRIVGKDGRPLALAGSAAASATTFWFPPKGSCIRGSTLSLDQINALPDGTRVLLGYRNAGTVSPKKPVFLICGPRWNKPDTWYWTNGKLISGARIGEKNIPRGAVVFVPQK